METQPAHPRQPWLAALLSLIGGPLGQAYAGRLRRSLVLWACRLLLLLAIIFALVSLPLERVGMTLLLLCLLGFEVFLAVDAFLLARKNRELPLKWFQRWWIYPFLYITFSLTQMMMASGARSFVAEAFVIPGRAMAPTLQPGDRIIVDKFWFSPDKLCRNDVVVYRQSDPHSQLTVKRVVGLPGDEIQVVDEKVLINGVAEQGEHAVLIGDTPGLPALINYGPVRVPAGACFVLGDNRRMSLDSRLTGPIPLSDLYGRACAIYWSREQVSSDPQNPAHDEPGALRPDRIGIRFD